MGGFFVFIEVQWIEWRYSFIEFMWLVDLILYFCFGYIVLNGVLLEVFEGVEQIYIFDFSIMYGM